MSRLGRDALRHRTGTRRSSVSTRAAPTPRWFAGDECLGWCQFGSPEELPEIKSRRRYEQDLTAVPDWRITCFFTGKGKRRRPRSPATVAAQSRVIPRRPTTAPCPARSCIPGRWPHSRTTASHARGRFLRTAGSSPAPSTRPDHGPSACHRALRRACGLPLASPTQATTQHRCSGPTEIVRRFAQLSPDSQ